jgi:hypothetical protein
MSNTLVTVDMLVAVEGSTPARSGRQHGSGSTGPAAAVRFTALAVDRAGETSA